MDECVWKVEHKSSIETGRLRCLFGTQGSRGVSSRTSESSGERVRLGVYVTESLAERCYLKLRS